MCFFCGIFFWEKQSPRADCRNAVSHQLRLHIIEFAPQRWRTKENSGEEGLSKAKWWCICCYYLQALLMLSLKNLIIWVLVWSCSSSVGVGRWLNGWPGDWMVGCSVSASLSLWVQVSGWNTVTYSCSWQGRGVTRRAEPLSESGICELFALILIGVGVFWPCSSDLALPTVQIPTQTITHIIKVLSHNLVSQDCTNWVFFFF